MPRLYTTLVIDRPWIALALLLLLAVVAAVGARDFRLDASSDSLVVETDPDLAVWREVSERYGGGDFLLVTYTPQRDLLDQQSIATVSALRDRLAEVEGVASVLSMVDVPLLRSPPAPLAEMADNIRTLTSEDVDLELAREELTTSPLYRELLVSADGRSTAIQINLESNPHYTRVITARNELLIQRQREGLDDSERALLAELQAELEQLRRAAAGRQQQLVADVRAVVDEFRNGDTLFVGGVTMIADDMLSFVRGDLRTFGVGVLLLVIAMLTFFFRRPRWVLLPLACGGLTVLYMVGILGWANWPITVISSNFVSLLIIISISLTIHLTVRFRELAHRDPAAAVRTLVIDTIRHRFWPCFYTAVTTMVAFASLVSSGIVPVVDFGWMMTIGVGVALIVAFTLFPAVVMLLPPNTRREAQARSVGFTAWLARGTNNQPTVVILACVLVAAFSAWGMSRLTVENSFIDYFQKSTEIYQGMAFVDEHLGGTTPLDVLIRFSDEPEFTFDDEEDPFGDPFADDFDSGDPFGDDPFSDALEEDSGAGGLGDDRYWFTPDKIALVERVHAYLDDQPETGKVISLATLHAIAMDFNDGQPLGGPELVIVLGAIPEEFQEALLRPYASPSANEARISIRMIDSDPNLKRDEFLRRIERGLVEEVGLDRDDFEISGMMVLFNNMLQGLFASQNTTLMWVAGGILVTFIVLFRSLTLGLIAIIPNGLAAAAVLGLMGAFGLPLDMMTITIAAIVVGIGVDGTIHYVHRFRRELPRAESYEAALSASHASIGHAIYYTALTVAAGFTMLVFSNFNPTIYFGSLTAAAMLLALLANLTLLPAILLKLKPFGPAGTESA
ncbi:MAG: MMPL family transporter [Gammaproteobacteria bacterium]|nr:MMPL family transporter [Gammaproteobacteria bacterium]